MLDPEQDVTICLTIAGAMTPAGIGGSIITLMERGAIDFMVSTGANLYHDIHHALNYRAASWHFKLNDPDLHEAGVIRIYDVLFLDEVLLDTDRFLRECFKTFPQRPDVHRRTAPPDWPAAAGGGRRPGALGAGDGGQWNVPIYTSSPGDSSIGMNLARHQLDGNALTIDPLFDVHETTAIVQAATRNGVIILGGGSPKNFYLQTQPQLWEVLGINKGGHDYFIQITQDAPHWGGLSGATPSEAVSWGKIKPEQLRIRSSSTLTRPSPSRCSRPMLSPGRPRARRELYSQPRRDAGGASGGLSAWRSQRQRRNRDRRGWYRAGGDRSRSVRAQC